ncbi:hypothetical protein [Spirillospora sp. NPDC029432]|uniref:hypothetical protein n=1 Tax=Spirillospora sp. NPDC029432 TaxID=3154599 RepID=UPI003452C60C
MRHLETVAFPLAAGTACSFLLAVVLKEAPWQAGFTAVTACAVLWSLLGTPLMGAALGGIAWAFVTGFDVAGSGDLVLTGGADAARAALLVAAGLLAGAAGRRLGGPGPGGDMPPAPEEYAARPVPPARADLPRPAARPGVATVARGTGPDRTLRTGVGLPGR